MFEPTKEDLKDVLKKVHEGKLQLPDFQRAYVWEDQDVRSLIASIAKGYPVGALLTLETGGEVRFKPRVLEGVPVSDVEPAELLLDGQQRMTSLYQATFSGEPVRTKTDRHTRVDRFYYLDIKKAVSTNADIEDAILGLPADRILRSNFGRDIDLDLSNEDREFELDYFPLNRIFDSRYWFYGWIDYWRARVRNVVDLERQFVRDVIERVERYKMPIIRLDRGNNREAICLVFEKVNVGGKKLDAFELVTAIYASDRFDLREDWLGAPGPTGRPMGGRRARLVGEQNPRDVLRHIASTDFLQACTLLHTREKRLEKIAAGVKDSDLPQITCKREALLDLPLAAYRKHADPVEKAFVEAARFLNEQKIIWHRDVPYPPQIVALAAAFAILGNRGQNAAAREKLAQWFWSVSLGELYGSATESKISRDVPMLDEWITADGPRPRSVEDAIFQQDRLRSLRTRNSAAYKSIHALLMRRGCRDFISGKSVDLMTFFDDKIDIHHVFPQSWCKKADISSRSYDSIVNKTALSKRSNIDISGDAPSVYLRRIERKHGIASEDLDAFLRSHLIEPEFLRADDYQGFFDARIKALSSLIAEAMGKLVVEEHGSNEAEEEVDPEPIDIDEFVAI